MTHEQPPGILTSSTSTTEQVVTTNQILTNVRQLRERLATESTEASQKLSQALLDIVLYAERVDSASRLLSLADSCIGQIRSRMRAHGIPIHAPSTPSNAILPPDCIVPSGPVTAPDNGPAIQGISFTHSLDTRMTNFLQMIRRTCPISVNYHLYRAKSCLPHVESICI